MHSAINPNSLDYQWAAMCRSPATGLDQVACQPTTHDFHCSTQDSYEAITEPCHRSLREDPLHIREDPILSCRRPSKSVQLSGTGASIVTVWTSVFKIWPTLFILTNPASCAMSKDPPQTKAACHDKIDIARLGFRAGLANVFQRCVERIFSRQSPNTPFRRASSTPYSRTRGRTLSPTEEEDYVARQVQEIYCKLHTIPHPASSLMNCD